MKLTVPLIKCLKNIYGALCDLVAFVQFKNVKDTHGGVLILILLHECFSRLLNCTNATKSLNAPHIKRPFIIWVFFPEHW